ncbi:MAG: response regulator [Sphingomonadales bacterium]
MKFAHHINYSEGILLNLLVFNYFRTTHSDPLQLTDFSFIGKRVLVADDMQLNQYLISQLLGQHGATVVTVSDGVEALARCQEQRFDLIILDIRMPRLDGIETCRAIRKLGTANSLVPIVALTAHMFEDEQLNYFSLGMNAAVVKPIDPESFLPLLQRLFTNETPTVEYKTISSENELRIDLSYLTKIGNGNLSFIAMMLASFLQNAEQLQQRLSTAVDTIDIKLIGEIAHQLKFSVGVLGIKALDEKLIWLQRQAQVTYAQDLDWFMVRSRKLQQKLSIIMKEARQLQRQYGN